MNTVIFNPLEEFESKYKPLHADKINAFFEELVKKSGVNVDENRQTVELYHKYNDDLVKLKRKYNWFRFLRVLMCITLVLIPFVILKTTPRIQQLRQEIAEADKTANKLFAKAMAQMQPLVNLFSERNCIDIIEDTIPLLDFHPCFSAKQEQDMRINYDFAERVDELSSTLGVLAGEYNQNPFLFENKLYHVMGTEIYHGYKTITWTESYRDSNGRLQTRTRSQTLHAQVTKPKPFYSTGVELNYCSQGGPELEFSRTATHVERKSEKEIEKMVKKGEKKLQKMTEKAIGGNQDFMSMSNSEFEVLFGALNRTNEVQFRTLFTPLAQTNLVELLCSKKGYGDDFTFIKRRRTNLIKTEHSQGRKMLLWPVDYASHSFDVIKENFISKNTEFFKDVYFDFAPIWAIPIYQERPVHSLKPIPDYAQLYSYKECEVLANMLDKSQVVHPNTKTKAILKSSYVGTKDKADETRITAYSYDIFERVDFIPVWGGDGRLHEVPVYWDDYIPLQAESYFFVADENATGGKKVLAQRNGICIFNS